MEPLNGQVFLDRQAQAQHFLREAQRQEYLDQARYFSALVALADNPHFQLVLTHMFQTLFLIPAPVREDVDMSQRLYLRVGAQEVLLRLLADLRQAQSKGATLAVRGSL